MRGAVFNHFSVRLTNLGERGGVGGGYFFLLDPRGLGFGLL